jgi:hypothetical protein
MGGLYNVLFGQNPGVNAILATLDLTPQVVGRLRDAWVEADGVGGYRIAVYTRNGGGNREHWGFSYPDRASGSGCPCPGCIQTHVLPTHPLYLFDRDDEFDFTYCTTYFRLPERYETELRATARLEPVNTDEAWRAALGEQ